MTTLVLIGAALVAVLLVYFVVGFVRRIRFLKFSRPPADPWHDDLHEGGLTWTCHVCGRRRPDDKISVVSSPREFKGVEVTENVRYCNDRQSCFEAAQKTTWLVGS